MDKPRSCTVERPDRSFCDRPSAPHVPFPVCVKHATMLYREMSDLLAAAPANLPLDFMLAEADRVTGRRAKRESGGDPVVYYVMVGDLVKIGYTRNLAARLHGYPPTAVLLATEPGNGAAEKARHREFAEYLAGGREWFTAGPRLRDHIESLPTFSPA